MKRYYVTRKPAKPEGGVWKVFDRQLDMICCSCEFREQANTVKDALNGQEEGKVEIKVNTADDSVPPVCQCNRCGRKSWDLKEVNSQCNMTQPNGTKCLGILIGKTYE